MPKLTDKVKPSDFLPTGDIDVRDFQGTYAEAVEYIKGLSWIKGRNASSYDTH